MVVFRIIGDDWPWEYRLGISVKPANTFQSRITDLLKALRIESFTGYALYRTEGKHPVIRPTIPVNINDNPAKNKLTADGTVLYVKKADLEQQRNDIIFHEGLLHFREEKGLKCMKQDASDVKEYIAFLCNSLNITDSTDIREMEEIARRKIEGDEMRTYWVITFEYREVQIIKDDEKESRDDLEQAFYSEAINKHIELIVIPRLMLEEMKLRKAIEEEDSYRELIDMEKKERPQLKPTVPEIPPPVIPPPPVVPEPPPVVPEPVVPPPAQIVQQGVGMTREDIEILLSGIKEMLYKNQEETSKLSDEMHKQFNETLQLLTQDMKRNASEMQELRAVLQGKSNVKREASLAIESKAATILEQERRRLKEEKTSFISDRNSQIQMLIHSPRNEFQSDLIKRLINEQNEYLKSLLVEEEYLLNQQRQATIILETGMQRGLHYAAIGNVAINTVLEQLVEVQQALDAKLNLIARTIHVEERRKKEIEEQQRLREEEDKREQEMLIIERQTISFTYPSGYSLTPPIRNPAVVLYPKLEKAFLLYITTRCTFTDLSEAMVSSNTSVITNHSYTVANEREMKGDIITHDKKRGVVIRANIASLGFQFSLDACYGPMSFLNEPITTAEHHSLVEFTEGRVDISSLGGDDETKMKEVLAKHYLTSLIIENSGSGYAIGDTLAWTFGVEEHVYRKKFLTYLEEFNVVEMIPALDLLLSIYVGKEVELLISLVPGVISVPFASDYCGAAAYIEVRNNNDDPTSTPYYYHPDIPDISQWMKPGRL